MKSFNLCILCAAMVIPAGTQEPRLQQNSQTGVSSTFINHYIQVGDTAFWILMYDKKLLLDIFFVQSNNKQLNYSVPLPQHKWNVPRIQLLTDACKMSTLKSVFCN